MAREDPHFRLRLPAELKDKIEHSAKMNSRSINAEIVSRLTNSFSPQVEITLPHASPDLLKAIQQMSSTIAMLTLKAAGYPVNEFSEEDKRVLGEKLTGGLTDKEHPPE